MSNEHSAAGLCILYTATVHNFKILLKTEKGNIFFIFIINMKWHKPRFFMDWIKGAIYSYKTKFVETFYERLILDEGYCSLLYYSEGGRLKLRTFFSPIFLENGETT